MIAELGEACYKYGLKMGMYYSQDLDWHEEHGGGYLSDPSTAQGVTWENSWDFPNKEKKNFDICFENKIYPQVEEILRNYGELCLIWFDMPMTLREEQSRKLYDAVKRYQPDCLINSRLGNGTYDYVSLGDNEIPSEVPSDASLDNVSMNEIDGFKPSPYGLYETAATMNHLGILRVGSGLEKRGNHRGEPGKAAPPRHQLSAECRPRRLRAHPLQCRQILTRAAELFRA